METRLSGKGLKLVSYTIISLFSLLALPFFLGAIDRTLVIFLVSSFLLMLSLYILWVQNDVDAASLLIFFFGTTACFNFFSGFIAESYLKFVAIFAFALLSLVLSNYLLNTVDPVRSSEKSLFKIVLAIIFTEIFWILSFINASPIAKGALTAVLFFNFQYFAKSFVHNKIKGQKFVILSVVSIILLVAIIYRI
jgi:hypothetical protein